MKATRGDRRLDIRADDDSLIGPAGIVLLRGSPMSLIGAGAGSGKLQVPAVAASAA